MIVIVSTHRTRTPRSSECTELQLAAVHLLAKGVGNEKKLMILTYSTFNINMYIYSIYRAAVGNREVAGLIPGLCLA